MAENPPPDRLRECTVKIVSGFVSHNKIEQAEIGTLISTVYSTLSHLPQLTPLIAAISSQPAVSIRQSIRPNMVICLDCGFKAKMLRRHLHDVHNLTPDQYRMRWRLPSDYPIVAPNYAEFRSLFAKQMGLGRYIRFPEEDSEVF